MKRIKRQHPTDPNLFRCPRCETYKEKEEFHKNCGLPHDIRSMCKRCGAEYKHKYRLDHKDKTKVMEKNSRDRRKGKVKSYEIKYRKTHKEKLSVYAAEYRKVHGDALLTRRREGIKHLSDSYIKAILVHGRGIANPSTEVIELNRQVIIMKRTLKEFKKWRKDYESNYTDVQGKQHADEEAHAREREAES
ncbi:MAG: hypothetical protein WC648_04835 [Candidatus Paceibacterota bacterium]